MSEIIHITKKKNEAATFFITLAESGDSDERITNPAFAAGDVRTSGDGGAFGNLATLPVVTPAGDKSVKVDLSAAEMNYDNVMVLFEDQTGPEAWEALTVSITTWAVDLDDLVRSTTPANTLDVSATGEAGLDFDNIKDASGAHTLTNVTVPVVTTLTGHTAQTGDSFARLAAPAGASIAADIAAIKAETALIVADTNEVQASLANGGFTDLLLDQLQTDITAILADTNELQTDWVNGGRLDLLIDAILADTDELQGDWVNAGRLDTILDAILADTGTDGVKIDMAQAYTEGQTARTTGGALEATEADKRNRVVDTGVGGQRVIYQTDNSSAISTRTHSATELTP
jgi:hypothetical protein